uniref:Uncharacterized protein n=1 Tax=Arundo donax TaxID=35708 RepID=A0A0A9D9N9_ARUDO
MSNSLSNSLNGHAAFSALMPQLSFPQFDGSSPKIWIRRSETFFGLYNIPKELWVKLSTMNFIGSTSFWLQSVESQVVGYQWIDLCNAINVRFEKDQYNHLIRQFFTLGKLVLLLIILRGLMIWFISY